MLKRTIKANAIKSVVAGQVSQLTISPGPRILGVKFIATVRKTAATSGYTGATLADALGLITMYVNTSPRRIITAQELNEVQQVWAAGCGARKYDHVLNDLKTAASANGETGSADATGTINGIASASARTTTYEFTMWFADPSSIIHLPLLSGNGILTRDSLGLPTAWNVNGQIKTADVSFDIAIPNNGVAGTSVFDNQALRAELIVDDQYGPLQGNTPIMPFLHIYRQSEVYSNTTPVINKWPFIGRIAQQSIFSPSGSGDDVTDYQLLINDRYIRNSGKKVNDGTLLDYGFNPARLQTSGGDVSGTNWPAADVMHLALDMDDDPQSWLNYSQGDKLELYLTLATASASNKVLNILSFIHRDGLTSGSPN